MGSTPAQFVLIEGGVVVESPPRTAVFDLDILDSDGINNDAIVNEVTDLLDRMTPFCDVLVGPIERCKEWLRRHDLADTICVTVGCPGDSGDEEGVNGFCVDCADTGDSP